MDEWLIGGILAFILGTIFGSFANVIIVRLYNASSLWRRSVCPHCRTPIRAQHLVPILSWLVLRGRCADCGKPIHPHYPLVEFAAGLLTVVAFLRHNPLTLDKETWLFCFEFFFSLVLLIVTVFDLRWKLLPIEFMAGSGVILGVVHWFLFRPSITSLLLGIIFGAAFLGIQVIISRGKWMGSGDPWLAAMIGAALGWPHIVISLYVTYIAGGALALFLLLSGFAKRGTRMPFAPLLALGAFVTLWFGERIESVLLSFL